MSCSGRFEPYPVSNRPSIVPRPKGLGAPRYDLLAHHRWPSRPGYRNEETPIELWPEPPPFRGFLFEAASQLLRCLDLGQARTPGLDPATAFHLSAWAPLPREQGRNPPPKPLPVPSVSTESLR